MTNNLVKINKPITVDNNICIQILLKTMNENHKKHNFMKSKKTRLVKICDELGVFHLSPHFIVAAIFKAAFQLEFLIEH